jgi:hypothetical protein
MEAGAGITLELDNHHSDWGRDGVSGWSDVATTNWSFRFVAAGGGPCSHLWWCHAMPQPAYEQPYCPTRPAAMLPARIAHSELCFTSYSSSHGSPALILINKLIHDK